MGGGDSEGRYVMVQTVQTPPGGRSTNAWPSFDLVRCNREPAATDAVPDPPLESGANLSRTISIPPVDALRMNPPPLPPPPQGRSLDRASYQAPTKASLARSHTERSSQGPGSKSPSSSQRTLPSKRILNDQPSEIGPKMFGLRDRKALRPSLPATASPVDSSNQGKPSPVSQSNRKSGGLEAFAAPPRRVSRRIVPSDLTFQSPAGMKREGLDTGIMNTPEDQLALELGGATGEYDRHGDWNPPDLDEEYEEPDLPPTPTQLGLEKLAGRSRGLLSSSPTTQRQGRRRTADLIWQSPSKPRYIDDGAEVESSIESAIAVTRALFPEPVSKKQRLREELNAEAQRLKNHIADLESWSARLGQSDDHAERDVSKVMSSLLASERPATTNAAGPPTDIPVSSLISTLLPFSSAVSSKSPPPSSSNPFAPSGASQGKPHLTVFAPLSLETQSEIVTNTKSAFLERHNIMFSVPPPFPPQLYSIHLTYEIDFENQALVSIAAPETVNGTMPQYLRQWMNSRLDNSLLKLDLSGFCWGINRYWEAVLSRAHMWLQLENHPATSPEGIKDTRKVTGNEEPNDNRDLTLQGGMESLTIATLRQILPHTQRTSMFFESEERAIRVMLSCEIAIDEWACEPQLIPSISVSGSSIVDGSVWGKTEQEAKDLFNAVIDEATSSSTESESGLDADAIIQATNHVLGALFGVDAEMSSKDETQ